MATDYNKYEKFELKRSDDGVNWVSLNPPVYRKGNVIEENSADCRNMIEPIYQWVSTGVTECNNWNKYSIEKQQISHDNGVTWEDTGETRSTLLEEHSSECPVDVNVDTGILTWLSNNNIPYRIGIDLGICQHIVTDSSGNYHNETWYDKPHYEWMTTTDSGIYELSSYFSFNHASNPCKNEDNRVLEYNYSLQYLIIPNEYNITQLIYDKNQNYESTPKKHFEILKKVPDSWTYHNIKDGWRRFNTTATTWCDGSEMDETIVPIVIPGKYDDCETFWKEFNKSKTNNCLDLVTDGTYKYYSGYIDSYKPYRYALLIVDSHDNVINRYTGSTENTNVPSIVFRNMDANTMFAYGENIYYAFGFGFTTPSEITPQVENISFDKVSFGNNGWKKESVGETRYSWGKFTYTKVNNTTLHVACAADQSFEDPHSSYSFDLNVITNAVTNFIVN